MPDSSFTTPDWVFQTNIYEVNLRQYTLEGTINSFRLQLPRLIKMGVRTLWFMPLTPIARKNRKGSLGSYYACSDYCGIDPEFGTENDFRKLVEEAHNAGMKIIIDWVANHTGWDHRWTFEHPDYYKKEPVTNDFQTASGMDDIIELDYDNPALVNAMISAMRYWVDQFDIDGFRCDLAFWVRLDFWKQARTALDGIKPLFWFGEFDELERPEFGEVFDAGYTWKWMHLTEELFKNEMRLEKLVELLRKYDDLGKQCIRCWFTSNHDENSWNGTEKEKYGQLSGNLAIFSMTWDGLPLVYSGQELPNEKRLAFFDRDTIEWKEFNELEGFYSQFLHLRSSHPALRANDPSITTRWIEHSQKNKALVYVRETENDAVLVMLNFTGDPITIELKWGQLDGIFMDFQTGKKFDYPAHDPKELQGWGYKVYLRERK